ncbi:MAG TPA: hypothetical protein VFR24_27780 [Candidatus Angelobacter sp.]|nr:hypothetical protein [Candidatus Angelobacter sp.]
MKEIKTVTKTQTTEYVGKEKPKWKIGDYMRVYCGSYQDHHFYIKDIRYNADVHKFEYLYDGCLMGGWYQEGTIVPAFSRQDWHYDSQGYCDNPGRGY